ncbi:hypothetical protein [Chitinilyticum piscinae]|uniref:Uncharacterized protein n=1 Tax=Chitinilyticum piscinae TaxID=2866724 RepID=A0A8J7FPM9_9NEIS|nr:hypothetical protein [Chitinilyticum piscinae]MBE9608286.1 hypothetical protein [Chitinilyticum piscinae]
MIIRDLQPGDCFAQELNGQTVRFEVLAIDATGRQVQVTFRSPQGVSSAAYHRNAYISAHPH